MSLAFFKVKLDPGAQVPTRAHETDVGYDVTANSVEILRNAEGNPVKLIIDTGLHIQPLSADFYAELVPNSRLAKTHFSYGNSIGIIDPDYTGSIKCILNVSPHAEQKDIARIRKGTVIGQLIIRHRHTALFELVDTLDRTERGTGSFGSTANQ